MLHKNGVLRVRPLQGGIEAWRERDFPLEVRGTESHGDEAHGDEPPGSLAPE